MDAGTLRGIFTVLMLLLFVAIVFWAYSGRRRRDFDEAAQLPLGPDQRPPARAGDRSAKQLSRAE